MRQHLSCTTHSDPHAKWRFLTKFCLENSPRLLGMMWWFGREACLGRQQTRRSTTSSEASTSPPVASLWSSQRPDVATARQWSVSPTANNANLPWRSTNTTWTNATSKSTQDRPLTTSLWLQVIQYSCCLNAYCWWTRCAGLFTPT